MQPASPMRIARLVKGLDQASLAAAIGVHQTYISDLERRTCRPRRGDVPARLAAVLEVPEASLFG